MCITLKVQRSSYYKRRKNKVSKTKSENKEILVMIKEVFKEHKGNYGSPRIHQELKKKGSKVGVNRVARIMQKESIESIPKKKFKPPTTTDSNHNLPIAENMLKQDFSEKEPGKVFISDITYIELKDSFVYLCAILDLASRKVIGWSLKDNMKTEILTEAYKRAYKMNKPKDDCLFHSDRGSQYASIEFRNNLLNNNIKQSMSRKGNCYDNACMESFFNMLKRELINKNTYLNIQELKNDLSEYIEVYYNNKRMHSSLGYMTPREYELKYFQQK
jgi:transposase InsO family protein